MCGNKILLSILAATLFFSCKKTLTVKSLPEHKSQIFIEGMLFPGQKPQIFVSESNSFFSTKVTPQQVFARRATVKITNNGIVDNLTADSTYNKFRCRWEPFYFGHIAAEYGKTYTLEVTLDGKTYSASTTINQNKVTIESIEYVEEFFDIYGGHDGVIIKLTDHPGTQDFYRFQMCRMIDATVKHAHVLDGFINTCASPDELFPVKDIGRIVFSDENADGQKLTMPIEVTYEYSKGDEGWISMQTLDKQTAEFYKNLDDQLQSIYNPFVEPVLIKTKIEGAIGVFGSAVLSDSILFVYPRDHP